MRYAITGIVVDDLKLFAPYGTIGRWAATVNSEMFFHAQRNAPINKRPNKTSGQPPVGSLLASIRGDLDRVGPRQFQMHTSVNVPYAMYVIMGTSAIYARGSGGRFSTAEGGMYLPANPGFGRARWRQRVRGQKANNFLEKAFAATARAHPSIKGYSMMGSL